MDFQQIKTVVQEALNSGCLSADEQSAVRTVVLSDSNKQRASLLMEILNLDPTSAPQQG
ncbi:MAG: hypothetical protein AAFY57_13305 [Cyanobacteria bacterium J06642_2]